MPGEIIDGRSGRKIVHIKDKASANIVLASGENKLAVGCRNGVLLYRDRWQSFGDIDGSLADGYGEGMSIQLRDGLILRGKNESWLKKIGRRILFGEHS